jgi:hypothetical protein
MPKKPSQEELNVIQEMFKASVDGELYDPDRFGQYYKPAGLSTSGSTPSVTATAPATPVQPIAEAVATPQPAPTVEPTVVEKTPEPAKVEVAETVTATATESTSSTGSKVSADDILSMIRSRQANKQ